MNKSAIVESSPTMIIPNGTEIQVDNHGQLSIRTPGNLVIQNSGNYGTIESVQGSIRIEPNVQVEAVNVRCSETCYVQGSLTAWKVNARSIELEDTARAHIILQETDRLEVGKEARLVGNFASEKELFLLFSRFAKQLRSMPFYFDRKEDVPQMGPAQMAALEAASSAEATEAESRPRPRSTRKGSRQGELPDPLFFALVLLEREAGRAGNGPGSQRVVDELIKLLRERSIEALRHTYKTLFGRLVEPSDDVKRANELVRDFFNA